jgi:paired amphipathic helix protein Sin3a
LLLFKDLTAKLVAQRANDSPSNPIASDLGLPSVPDAPNLPDRLANAEHFYDLLLESCESLFDNKLDQHAFEDQMRYIFGTKVGIYAPSGMIDAKFILLTACVQDLHY